jgi:5-methylcytosine-specific restriction endonuclease McrA
MPIKRPDKIQNPIPDFAWYQKQSQTYKQPSRCPFASARICPRYFFTLGLFGQHGLVERMSLKETDKLKNQLDQSPLFSPEFQPQPEVKARSDGTVVGWEDCCPELVFGVYHVFAVNGRLLYDKSDERLRHAELRAQNVHPDDWRWKFDYLAPMHFRECREFSILTRTTASKNRGDRREARNISPKQRWEIFERDKYTCKYCGRKPPEVALTVDHFVPVDADGTKEPDNLVTACQDCNAGKSNRRPPKL